MGNIKQLLYKLITLTFKNCLARNFLLTGNKNFRFLINVSKIVHFLHRVHFYRIMQANSVLIAIFFILPTIKSDQSIDKLCAILNGSIPWNDTDLFDGRFTQYQDHFDPQNEVRWQQRFYAYPETWKSGGPILIYMEAEQALTKFDNPPIVERIAEEFNGLQIGWEHRYYGQSQPEQHRRPFGKASVAFVER